MTNFISNLSSLLQTLLIVLVLIIGFYLARRWRIARLRRWVKGQLPLGEEVKQAVARLFSNDVLEVAAIGAVTYLDVAWQYSLADPQIWSHLDNVETLANPQALEAGLGTQAPEVMSRVADYLHQTAAIQSFDQSLDSVMQFGTDIPNSILLLDGHPQSLFDVLGHKDQAADALVDAKAQGGAEGTDAAVDAKTSALADAKSSVLDAKASALDAKTGALADAKASALDAKASVLVDAPWTAELWHHVPVITIGFAAYRAWRRSEEGTTWERNLEFAATEVLARSGGALAGAKMGGTVGTLVVPGYGTIVGSVVGAVGGAIAGAQLSEAIKRRHVRRAQRELDQALHDLGEPLLRDPVRYRRLKTMLAEQEREAQRNIKATRRQYQAHARWWRRLWPDRKLLLLQETMQEADERLMDIHRQVRDILERIEVLHRERNYKALGVILWNAPEMCERLGCAEPSKEAVEAANDQLRHELQQVGLAPAAVA